MKLNHAEHLLNSIATQTQPGVYHSDFWGQSVPDSIVSALETIARENPNRKARLCMHPTLEDENQQMLVALHKECVDTVHFHPRSAEAVVWVKGLADHFSYSAHGELDRSIRLGKGNAVYVSTPEGIPHNILILSDVFVFWEFSKGPFLKDSSIPFFPNQREQQ